MSAVLKPPPDHMTVAEFLEWDGSDHSGRAWQLRDGVPEAMAPASNDHGAIQFELAGLIGNHLVQSGSRCRGLIEPGVIPRVRGADNMRLPDLAVICEPASRQGPLTEPLLLVEILSPANAAQTWANVWSYTTIPSVAEILVVSGTDIGAQLLRRGADGDWPATPVPLDRASDLTLASIGLTVALTALYRTTSLV